MDAWLKVLGSAGHPVTDAWAVKQHGKDNRRLDQSVMFARRPGVKPGDRIVYYSAGTHNVFAEGKVTSAPYSDPLHEAFEGSDGRLYPYWVDVAIDVSVSFVKDGVPLAALSVDGRDLLQSVRRRGLLKLRPKEYQEVLRLLSEAQEA
ncbi:MAG TPA: EVE domain-containing protein [Anaerolineales bacterium]